MAETANISNEGSVSQVPPFAKSWQNESPQNNAKWESDDNVLVKQSQRGKISATGQLLSRYQNRIYNVILKICANPDDAAELTQETFVKVIENLNKFEARSSFYTWAFRIAVNLTLNYCQRRARFASSPLDAAYNNQNYPDRHQLEMLFSDDSSPDPSAVAANKELCEIVKDALMKLEDGQRAVLVLRDIEGMSYARIAEVLNIELGTVKSRISRARSNLREILQAVLK